MKQTFSSPVNASNFIADAGTCKGVQLHSINYDTGIARFSLIQSDDTVLPQVNGTDPIENISEADVAEEIRALVDATN